jgi:hypothetical protein
MTEPEVEEQFGAVALLDILGAKALFQDLKAATYLDSLKAIRDQVEESQRVFAESKDPHGIQLHVAFFSDTLLLCASWRGKGFEVQREELIRIVASQVQAAIHAALTLDRPLTYRGCIAFGNVTIDGPFFGGPAVNEAAALYEQAEAAVVWLAPSASRIEAGGKHLMPWDVPLKGGHTLRFDVVNPLTRVWEIRELSDADDEAGVNGARRKRMLAMMRIIRKTFSSPTMDVELKKQKTEALLQEAFNVCANTHA